MAKRKSNIGRKGGTGCGGLLILVVMAALFGAAGRQTSSSTSDNSTRYTSTTITTRSQALVSQPVTRNTEEYTATSNANVRSCPKTTCDIVRGISLGERLTKIGEVQGESINGSSLWYEIRLATGATGFIHSGLARAGTPRPSPVAQATQPAAQSNQRPDNCDHARAMGLTAQQAAQWPHLDLDDDGVACYGD